MTDEQTFTNEPAPATAPTVDAPTDATPTTTPTKRPSRPKVTTKTRDEPKKFKCAYCGKTDAFTIANVGEQKPISLHGCSESLAAMHAWQIDVAADPTSPAPRFVAK